MRYDTRVMGDQRSFETTSWSLVRAAKDLKALESLIAVYWKPLYFFIRQHGYDNETSKDMVQEFLSGLIERQTLTKADPQRGRFRTFLLAALSNFLKDRAKAADRQKRGGGQQIVSLDFSTGEREYTLQVAKGDPPETVLNRAWARSLWGKALEEIQGDPAHREALRLYLGDADYKTIAEKTGLTEGAAKTAVHRMKGQLRDKILAHIRETVSSEEELQAEVTEFLSLLK
jgi:RNA polymerase sigma factor (sigma-70 family)